MSEPGVLACPETGRDDGIAETSYGGRQTVRRCRIVAATVLALLVALAVGLPAMGVDLGAVPVIVGHMFWHQDIYFLSLVFGVLLLRPVQVTIAPQPIFARDRFAFGVAIVLLLVCWIGHYLVFDHYSLSRDEAMAQFDTYIFAHGRLTWPFPPNWRQYADALNMTFVLPIGQHDAWVSAYLPINAAIRAAIGHIADVWLSSPAFVAVGALALWSVGKRLWPDSPASRVVALVLYAGSAQILFAGMTAYAMSGHVGLNLLWLGLFLRGGKAGHAGAILVGFLAIGLHQPLFHPMFVAPIFIEVLRGDRRWRLLLVYLIAYTIMGVFWLAWPDLMAHAYGEAGETPRVGFIVRLVGTVRTFDAQATWTMALNLIRFATWQHLFLLPLLAVGIIAARGDAMARALAIGLVLPVVVMAVLLPVQGHGWGYRYVHGVLGNACLLAGYGWRWLESRGLSYRRALAGTTLATFALGMPVHAVMARRMVVPYAQAAAAVAAIPADVVIVDDHAGLWAGDLVINRPDLTNRPIKLAASRLRPGDMASLCRNRRIAFYGYRQLQPVRTLYAEWPIHEQSREDDLEAAAREAGCSIIPVSPRSG